MATVTGDFSIDFSGLANQNPYTNSLLLPLLSSQARIASGVFRAINNSTSCIFQLDPDEYVPGDVIVSKIEVSDTGGGFDGQTCGVVDASGNGYRIYVFGWGISRHRIDAWTPYTGSGAEVTFSVANADTFEVQYTKSTGVLVVRHNGAVVAGAALTDSTYAAYDLAPYFGSEPGDVAQGGIISFAADGVTAPSAAPVISDGRPTGTIGTPNSAVVGVTSTQSTGTLYAVLSETSSDFDSVTAEQVIAGEDDSGNPAPFADSASVSDSDPEMEFTVLDADTTYYVAAVHETVDGASNVLKWSFTTADDTPPASTLGGRLSLLGVGR